MFGHKLPSTQHTFFDKQHPWWFFGMLSFSFLSFLSFHPWWFLVCLVTHVKTSKPITLHRNPSVISGKFVQQLAFIGFKPLGVLLIYTFLRGVCIFFDPPFHRRCRKVLATFALANSTSFCFFITLMEFSKFVKPGFKPPKLAMWHP